MLTHLVTKRKGISGLDPLLTLFSTQTQ